MAVNKPTGDNAPQRRSEEANAAKEPAHQDFHKARQERRSVHGREEERQEVQGRPERKVSRSWRGASVSACGHEMSRTSDSSTPSKSPWHSHGIPAPH